MKQKQKQKEKQSAKQPLKNKQLVSNSSELGRGEIKDNFLAALVTSKVYKMQVVKAKKGKGSFKRKAKHKGQEPYLMAA